MQGTLGPLWIRPWLNNSASSRLRAWCRFRCAAVCRDVQIWRFVFTFVYELNCDHLAMNGSRLRFASHDLKKMSEARIPHDAAELQTNNRKVLPSSSEVPLHKDNRSSNQ